MSLRCIEAICPVRGAGKDEFEAEAVAAAPSEEAHVAEHTPETLVIVGSGLAGYSLAN